MGICGVYLQPQQSAILAFTGFPTKVSWSRRRSVELRVNGKPELSFISKEPILKIIPHAAASSSAAGNSGNFAAPFCHLSLS